MVETVKSDLSNVTASFIFNNHIRRIHSKKATVNSAFSIANAGADLQEYGTPLERNSSFAEVVLSRRDCRDGDGLQRS